MRKEVTYVDEIILRHLYGPKHEAESYNNLLLYWYNFFKTEKENHR